MNAVQAKALQDQADRLNAAQKSGDAELLKDAIDDSVSTMRHVAQTENHQ